MDRGVVPGSIEQNGVPIYGFHTVPVGSAVIEEK